MQTVVVQSKPRHPNVLVYDTQYVVAFDTEGRLPASAWLVGNQLHEGRWPRETLVRLCEDAGLDPLTVTGGRLSRLTEFQRACRSIEGESIGERHILVRLPEGREVQLNAHLSIEVKSVDGSRVGHTYQLNRRIKYYVEDIEKTLAPGIPKQMVMEALGALADTDHEITQNIGKWTLDDTGEEPRIVATLYEGMANDPTGASLCFMRSTHRVRRAFEELADQYTHKDLRNAWARNWRLMTGSFPFDFGAGGIFYIPVHYKPQLDAWERFFRLVYGEKSRFTVLPVTRLKEAQEAIQRQGEAWLKDEWDAMIERTLLSLRKADTDAEKFDKACTRARKTLTRNMAELREAEAAINTALEERFQVHAWASSNRLQQLRQEVDDPRIRGVFLQAGLLEEDEEAEFILPRSEPAAAPSAESPIPAEAQPYYGLIEDDEE